MKIDTGMTLVRRVVPRALRAHPFVCAIIASVLLGGGLRYIQTDAAAASGSNVPGQGSTACAAP